MQRVVLDVFGEAEAADLGREAARVDDAVLLREQHAEASTSLLARAIRGDGARGGRERGTRFLSLEDAEAKIERWRHDYNNQRLQSMLGYMAPNQYALSATGDSAPGIQA